MNATKKLTDEHKNILKLADALTIKVSEARNKKIDNNFFEKAIFFIRNYADKFHHAKEEDILFKEICKSAEKGEMHCNPVEQMLHEHELGRGFVKATEEGIKEGNSGKVAENAESYARLIQEHIFKEDNILYPMAEESLSEKAKKEMLKRFDSADKKAKQVEIKCMNILGEIAGK